MATTAIATADPALRRLIDQVLTARDTTSPLDIRGGGTKAFYGGPAVGEPLDLRPLAGISSHEPTELVVTARAGTPLAELEAALAEHGQCLPFEPPRFANGDDKMGGTVGGMVAAGLAGPGRISAGALRDYVLGATMLNGRGELLTFGGQVMKNVAGYDVSRLLAGSLGVLGVICEVSLKVLPRPAEQATLEFELDEAGALAWFDARRRQPLPVTASSWHAGMLRVRLRGAGAAVRSAWDKLGGRRLDAAAADAWWDGVRDQRHPFFFATGDDHADGAVNVGAGSSAGRSSSPDSGSASATAAAVLTAAPAVGSTSPGSGTTPAGGEPPLWRLSLPATAAPLALPGDGFVEWGGAQRWWRTPADAAHVRAVAARAGGHATLFRGGRAGDRAAGAFAPLPAPLLRIHRELKAAFDPQRLFNPGRLYPDL